MATVTQQIIELGGGVLVVEATFDDVSFVLDSVRAVNTSASRSFTIQLQRGNGSNWRVVTAGPGFDQTFNAGGPVKNLDDLSVWRAG